MVGVRKKDRLVKRPSIFYLGQRVFLRNHLYLKLKRDLCVRTYEIGVRSALILLISIYIITCVVRVCGGADNQSGVRFLKESFVAQGRIL